MQIQGGRRCVFCGNDGKLSKEHVMPQWIWREVYGEKPTGTTVQSFSPSKYRERFDSGPDGPIVRTVEPRGDQPLMRSTAVTVKAVCLECNNGWMAALEAEVKPVIMRMNRDARWRLTAEDVSLLRRWAMKTALVNEWTDPEGITGTQEMRCAVAAGEDPPGAWYIGLCRAKPDVEFRLTHSPLIASKSQPDADQSHEEIERISLASQLIVVAWRVFFIVRFTPYVVHPPARLDHELRYMPGGLPIALNERMVGRSWNLKKFPAMTREHIRQLTYWGHGRTSRGGLHMGLEQDGRTPGIFDPLNAERSFVATGEYESAGVQIMRIPHEFVD